MFKIVTNIYAIIETESRTVRFVSTEEKPLVDLLENLIRQPFPGKLKIINQSVVFEYFGLKNEKRN